MVVHLQHAFVAHRAVVRAWRLGGDALATDAGRFRDQTSLSTECHVKHENTPEHDIAGMHLATTPYRTLSALIRAKTTEYSIVLTLKLCLNLTKLLSIR